MRRSNARSLPSPKMDSSSSSKPQFRSPPTIPFSLLSRIATPKHRTPLWIAFSFSAAVAAAVFCLFLLRRSAGDERYGIVIDGGSTGTRVHVYRYFAAGRGMEQVPVVDFRGSETMKVNPGLSAYAGDPERAGESIVELLEFARRRVRRDLWRGTEVRLMATAGLRLLDGTVQERILESCRKVLRDSGFVFRREWASVITGSDEGIYAWVTANYALGTLGSDPQKTSGIIELGGASAQVTFVSSETIPPEFSYVLRFGKTTYNLYSHSFLHFGQSVAHESLHKSLSSGSLKSSLRLIEGAFADPCTPRGYPHGLETKYDTELNTKNGYLSNMHTTGNFSECRSAALTLLQKGKDECLYQHCNMGSVFVPKLKGRFLATENFYYTSKFLGLRPTSFLSDMVMAGEQFCGEDWMRLKSKYHFLAEEDLLRYCFSSAYIVAMLHDSLGIPLDDKRVHFANQVGEIPLDWALGAFVMARMSDPEAELRDSINDIIINNFSALVLVIVMLVLICTVWWVSKWRKPQLKTIYDLEKGRYIITRVSP